MPRQIQFGVRKNPAPSSRQHGLRLSVDSRSENASANDIPQTPEHPVMDLRTTELQHLPHATPPCAATAGQAPNADRLLTVNEVAALLQVPVSWVYGRTRKRSLERLPGYRLGKYWRFDRDEVLAWIQRQRENFRAA